MKDNSKCKEWERRRRDRLNDAFKNLAQLLPHYDPAKIPPKMDILEKATQFVKELRLSNSRLLTQQTQPDEKSKLIKELQDEVNKLILRVKQLTTLLKQAKISIPIGPRIKLPGKKRLKWTKRLTPENVENSTEVITICDSDTTGNINNNRTCKSDESNYSGSQNSTPLKEANSEKGNSVILPEPVKSAGHPTPVQTTIILTSCTMPQTLLPLSNMELTRIAIPHRILPKPVGENQLQKIPILPIRKAVPRKIKRRRKRLPKAKGQILKPSVITCSTSPPKSHDVSTETAPTGAISPPTGLVLPPVETELVDGRNTVVEPMDSLIKIPITENQVEEILVIEPNSTVDQVVEVISEVPKENTVLSEKEANPKDIPQISDSVSEILAKEPDTDVRESNLAEIICENVELPDRNPSETAIVQTLEPILIEKENIISANSIQPLEHDVSLQVQNSNEPELVSVPVHQTAEMEVSESEPANSDKISECIARSIDLIDPPEGELMELGGDWGEAHSPKSPISPTQMFLSMFPLLPKESMVTVSEGHSQSSKNSVPFGSVKSSFFIDAMIPEENSVSNENDISNSHTLTSVSSSMGTTHTTQSLSINNTLPPYSLVGSTCLAVAPIPRQDESTFQNLENLGFLSASLASSPAKKQNQHSKVVNQEPQIFQTLSSSQQPQYTKNHSFDHYPLYGHTSVPSAEVPISSHHKRSNSTNRASNSGSTANLSSNTSTVSHDISTFSTCVTTRGNSNPQHLQLFRNAASSSDPVNSTTLTGHQQQSQHPTFHPVSRTTQQNSNSDIAKNHGQSSYRPTVNSYSDTSVNQTHHTQSQNQTVQRSNQNPAAKSQLFRPALSEFNTSSRMHSQEVPTQNYTSHTNSSSSVPPAVNMEVPTNRQSKNLNSLSYAPLIPPPIPHQNSTSHKYPPMPSSLTHSHNIGVTNPGKTHSSSSQHKRHYPQSSEHSTYPQFSQQQDPQSQNKSQNQPGRNQSHPQTTVNRHHSSSKVGNENVFQMDFSQPFPVISQSQSSSRTNNPVPAVPQHTAIPLAPPMTDFASGMNFNQYYDHHAHSSRNPSQRHPFYLPQVTPHCEALPIPGLANPVNPGNQLQTHSHNKPSSNPAMYPQATNQSSKNYLFEHSQGHSLYQHSLHNVSHAHQVPEPPSIYTNPTSVSRQLQACTNTPVSQNPLRSVQSKPPNKPTVTNQPQAHYPITQNQSNNNACHNQPNQSASNIVQPSSRPVNWMTDPPYRKPSAPNALFSVSKLVGNPTVTPNNSYCAEALIRKNPEWNDFHFTPPPAIPPPAIPPPQAPPHTFVPYQAQNEHPGYSNFGHHHYPTNPTTHFGHFDSTQHHQSHHLPGHGSTNSSISNFNLSSIFPEMNDKRSNPSASNNNDSSNPRCSFYPGKQNKPL